MCAEIRSPGRYDRNSLVSSEASCIMNSLTTRFILAYSYQPYSSKCLFAVLHIIGPFVDKCYNQLNQG